MASERFALLETEEDEARLLKRSCPFREWYIVKPEAGPALFLDSKRKAQAHAKKHAPSAIYKVE